MGLFVMARQAVILYQAIDYSGKKWDIREERITLHGWKLLLGWPISLQRGVGAGGPRTMINKALKKYFEEYRYDPGLMVLPIGSTAIKRLRRILGHHRYRDRPLWWKTKRDDLLTMTLSHFCEKYKCSMGAASQMRKKYKEQICNSQKLKKLKSASGRT